MWCAECCCDAAAVGLPGERRCAACGARFPTAGSPLLSSAAAGVELAGRTAFAEPDKGPPPLDDWQLARSVNRWSAYSSGVQRRVDSPPMREAPLPPRGDSTAREAPATCVGPAANAPAFRGFGYLGGLAAFCGVAAAAGGLAIKWLLELGVNLPTWAAADLAPRIFESGVFAILFSLVLAARRLGRNHDKLVRSFQQAR